MLPTLLRLSQPLRHLLVLKVGCPTLSGTAPSIIDYRQIDAAVDEELHGFVVFVKPYKLMHDAGRLMRAPLRVDIGAVLEKKVGDLEVVVEDRPGERGIENLLHTNLAPFSFPWVYAAGGLMFPEIP